MDELKVIVGDSPKEIYKQLEELHGNLYEIVNKDSKVYFKLPFFFKKEYTFEYRVLEADQKPKKKELIDLLKEASMEKSNNETTTVVKVVEPQVVKIQQEEPTEEAVEPTGETVESTEEIFETAEVVLPTMNDFTSEAALAIKAYLEEQEFSKEHIEHLMLNAKCSNESTTEEWIAAINEIFENELTDWKELNEYQIMTLFGPTGVGKTTTLVKITDRLQTGDKKIGVINTDNFRVGAREQIKNYSDLMHFTLIQSDAEELRVPIDSMKYQKGMDYVLIDTYGRNPKDQEMISELDSYLANVEPDCACLVLSATQKYKDMTKTINLYKDVRIDYIIITKLDETDSVGFIYNILKEFDLPISYITFGQEVPGDIDTFKVKSYIERIWQDFAE